MTVDISFIILTWNSEKHISRCLDALFASMAGSPHTLEAFVIDNGSRDATVPIINTYSDRYGDSIIPILLEHNTGTTYSRNLGLRRASGEYIVVMDSDVQLKEGSIIGSIDTFKTTQGVGLVAPRLLYPDGTLQKSTDNFPTVQNKLFRLFFLKTIEVMSNKATPPLRLVEVDYAISALWVLSKTAFEKVGFLDENIFYAPEDVDYCLRLYRAGYKVVYNPEVTAIHDAQETSRGFSFNPAMFNHLKGLVYYFRKYGYLFTRPSFK